MTGTLLERTDGFEAAFTLDRPPDRRGNGPSAYLRSTCGRTIVLHVERWLREPTDEETGVLDHAVGPVLDVGCGPARHTLELRRREIVARGLDRSRRLVRLARERGAPVVCGSVFDPLPDEGRWGTILLLDGNVGIGGDPERLLTRSRTLLRPGGRALIELEAPGVVSHRLEVVLEIDGERRSAPFPWALVSVDDIDVLARRTGFVARTHWCDRGRWFTKLEAR